MPKKRIASAKKKTGSGARSVPPKALEAECQLLREDIAQMQARLEQRVLDATLGQSTLKAVQNRQTLIEERAAKREAVLGAGLLALAAQRDELIPQLIELTELTEQVNHLQNDLEARSKQLETAEEGLAAARAEIEAIHNSKLWKITKPMRAVRQGLNKT
jgi:predicted  nucleic acid-binding Zn-ribbon protein